MAPKKQIKSKRVFSKQQNLMHDLHKLQVASSIRYIGITEDGHRSLNPAMHPDQWTKVEHCHFFHTIDSRGRPQDKCTPINGHFHFIEEVSPATDSEPAVYKCSAPKKFVFDKLSNRKIIVDVPFDSHTHEVEYLRSEVLEPKNLSAEAVQRASNFILSTTPKEPEPVSGIIG